MNSDKKKPNIRLYCAFTAVFIVIFAVYRIMVMMVETERIDAVWFAVLMWVYLITASALFVSVIILQRGFSNKPITDAELPDTMSRTEKLDAIAADKKRKRLAKYLLMPCVAFIFVFMFEIIELYYLPAIKGWLSSF